ncbi:threonine/homoserine/homoserine lactone efflux protein [Deinobacterium chartae]|uniref:Threonine/homoserine/homoserine lactone efflux protein n=1 Tax=Deinobacterium chartae TaxID=521158 RepID=A0A841HXH2_9DEIO|nr:LysE family translocator [Deinobacterium chartae]MBB6097553.1 threonine/homoserine/homoserine lactone efflux protein [Deinobacterium chartae]
MPDPSTLGVFLLASLALLVVPGPAVMYIMARSLQQGRRAGLASVLGIEVGGLIHVIAATLGLSALLASSALAFSVVKYAGAAYLLYLGLRALLGRAGTPDLHLPAPQALGRVFVQGVMVGGLNPKTALFFLAFLPQFVRPEAGPAAPQVLLLGMLFIGCATVSDSLYALLASTLGRWLQVRRNWARKQRYLSGGVYVALGVSTAVSGEAPGTRSVFAD